MFDVTNGLSLKAGLEDNTMAVNNVPSDIILTMNQDAIAAKKAGRDVLNGTIGMMLLDDGSLPVSSSMRKILAKHTEDEDLSYPSVAGPKEFLTSATRWFFANTLNERFNDGEAKCLGTMGGTGAVSASVKSSSCGKKALVLIPSYCWPNYPAIADGYEVDHVSYDLFAKNGSFGLESISSKIKDAKSKGYEAVTIIVNDPCHNPTGFSMSNEEWVSLVEILNEASSSLSISLIADCAYIDFAPEESKNHIISTIKCLKSSICVYLCMSFSKTFSFYGLRIGLLIVTSPDKELVALRYKNCIKAARATWSVPNHMAMDAIADALGNEETFMKIKSEVKANRDILFSRSAVFIKEAKEVGLTYLPYKAGFFVSIPCDDAVSVCQKLQGQDIFLAPVSTDCLRVALSSIPTSKVPGLALKIKKVL